MSFKRNLEPKAAMGIGRVKARMCDEEENTIHILPLRIWNLIKEYHKLNKEMEPIIKQLMKKKITVEEANNMEIAKRYDIVGAAICEYGNKYWCRTRWELVNLNKQ